MANIGYSQVRAGKHVENGLITPTFKLKRTALRNHYAERIEQIYQVLKTHPPAHQAGSDDAPKSTLCTVQ